MTAPPCKQAHALSPTGWVHTKDGKPCKHMNAAHARLAALMWGKK